MFSTNLFRRVFYFFSNLTFIRMYFICDSTVELGKSQAYDSQRGFSISGILLVIGGIGDFFTNKINNQIKK